VDRAFQVLLERSNRALPSRGLEPDPLNAAVSSPNQAWTLYL
jgi:hypothetical protein